MKSTKILSHVNFYVLHEETERKQTAHGEPQQGGWLSLASESENGQLNFRLTFSALPIIHSEYSTHFG